MTTLIYQSAMFELSWFNDWCNDLETFSHNIDPVVTVVRDSVYHFNTLEARINLAQAVR